jgi:hypothetical protein
VLVDAIALPLALWSAIALRLGEINPDVLHFWPAFVVSSLVCIPVFGALGLYRHVVRHMGNHAMMAVLKGATITAIVVAAVAYMVPLQGFPRSVPIIFWLLTLVYVSGSRFVVRGYFQRLQSKLSAASVGGHLRRRQQGRGARAGAAAAGRLPPGRLSRRRQAAAAAHHRRAVRLLAAVSRPAAEGHRRTSGVRRGELRGHSRPPAHHRVSRAVSGAGTLDSRSGGADLRAVSPSPTSATWSSKTCSAGSRSTRCRTCCRGRCAGAA